jgi:hypothetical protein
VDGGHDLVLFRDIGELLASDELYASPTRKADLEKTSRYPLAPWIRTVEYLLKTYSCTVLGSKRHISSHLPFSSCRQAGAQRGDLKGHFATPCMLRRR